MTITGMKKDPRVSILEKLDESTIQFYPTGSYYFGGVHAQSDYDFFCANVDGVEKFLKGLGFRLARDSGYDRDVALFKLYRHSSGIDVQIVHDLLVKLGAQIIIEEMKVNTSDRAMWIRAYRATERIVEKLR